MTPYFRISTLAARRLSTLSALCVLWLATTAPSLAQDSLVDVIARAEKSVVRIEVSGADGDSLGSGFVVDDRGTLVTNCHVLAGATRATAYFPDGRNCPIEGSFLIDESRDIVVAKIGITQSPAIPIARELPRKGERVTALGSPHGLSFTATTGIVSAIRSMREMSSDTGRDSIQGTWIQVDAALSPGNSGGPLINGKGEVVAMSTLASLGGTAQNLNFGISAVDISNAISKARSARLTSLNLGVAKVKMEQGSQGGGGLAEHSIPDEAYDEYIQLAKEDYAELMRGLRREAARLTVDLKEMRKGATYLPASARAEGASIVRVATPGRRERKWYFASQSVKQNAVDKQQDRIRSFTKLKNEVKDVEDPGAMFQLLWNYGPPINLREEKSIGYLSEVFVIHSFNEHDVLAIYDDKPCLVWMDSTAGVAGGDILSGPAFVAGTSTAQLSDGMTASLTVLQELKEEDLEAAVKRHYGAASSSPGSPGSYRTWNDRTGKFSVQAILLTMDGDHAVLKKQDGSVIRVPISLLSDTDKRYVQDGK